MHEACGFFSLDIRIAGGVLFFMEMIPNTRFLDVVLNIMIIDFHPMKTKKAKLKGRRSLQPLMRDL